MNRSGVTLVAGLGYGDEGKGTIVDRLVRDSGARLVVRYNGGAQAAHNVVTPDGRHHTFAQLGSGTFAGAETLLSRFVLVNPIALESEARALARLGVDDPLARVAIEDGALVTTPFHVAMNRLREMARSRRHGSCGMGIGETMEESLLERDVLRVSDLRDRARTAEKLASLRERKLRQLAAFVDDVPRGDAALRELEVIADEELPSELARTYADFAARTRIVGPELLARTLGSGAPVVFEGAQGILLDQDLGFQPYTTWTDITYANAWTLLREAGVVVPVVRLGVLRAYATRHGAGPFVSEDPAFDPLSAHDHNRAGPWQGTFRSGALDEVALGYAIDALGGIDALAVTNLDRLALLGDRVPVCVAYDEGAAPVRTLRAERPVTIASQTRLAGRLFAARPVLESVEASGLRGALAYADRIADRAGAPLALASFGATADDKIARGAARSRAA